MIDEQTGRKRKAFADELIQPQELFLFYAQEERKRMRREDSGAGNMPSGTPSGAPSAGGHSKTHHIG